MDARDARAARATRANARLVVFALFGLTAAACGADGGGSGPGGITPAVCVAGKLVFTGDLDGDPFDVQVDPGTELFQQFSPPFSWDLNYTAGMLHLQWNSPIFIDGSGAAATGTMVMPAGAPHAGETICGASGTIAQKDTSGGTGAHVNNLFALGTLSAGPTCPGAALSGGISGCVER
jgi:hypothetical protein